MRGIAMTKNANETPGSQISVIGHSALAPRIAQTNLWNIERRPVTGSTPAKLAANIQIAAIKRITVPANSLQVNPSSISYNEGE